MVENHQKIHELGTNRRTRNKREDGERNQRENSKGSGGRMERRTGKEEFLRDIYKIPKRNERGGLERKSRVNGVVESENKTLNLGENSWQRNRETCAGCSWERETLEPLIMH